MCEAHTGVSQTQASQNCQHLFIGSEWHPCRTAHTWPHTCVYKQQLQVTTPPNHTSTLCRMRSAHLLVLPGTGLDMDNQETQYGGQCCCTISEQDQASGNCQWPSKPAWQCQLPTFQQPDSPGRPAVPQSALCSIGTTVHLLRCVVGNWQGWERLRLACCHL